MPSCTIRQVYDAASKCWVTRCIDGVSPNRKHIVCYDHSGGNGAVMAPTDLPVAVAAPGVGLFTPPPGGWVEGLSDSLPGMGGFPAFGGLGGFGSYVGGPVFVHDAWTGEWVEDGAYSPGPGLPVSYAPMPSSPLAPFPLPTDSVTEVPGLPSVPVGPATPVPEPSAFGLFVIAAVAITLIRKRRA